MDIRRNGGAYREDWLDQYDDSIAHFRKVAKKMTAEQKSVINKLEINLQEKLEQNTTNRKNLGYAIPKAVYDKLGMYHFFQYKQCFVNTQYERLCIV